MRLHCDCTALTTPFGPEQDRMGSSLCRYAPVIRRQHMGEKRISIKNLKSDCVRSLPGGAGAYIFAKRAVNSERAARHEERMKRKEATLRQEKQSMPAPVKPPIPVAPTPSAASANETRTPSSEYGGGIAEPSPHPYNPPPHSTNQQHGGHMSDDVGNPSQEGARDPAPTRHEPDTEAQRVAEKGKYEAAETFRSRKGNRLS